MCSPVPFRLTAQTHALACMIRECRRDTTTDLFVFGFRNGVNRATVFCANAAPADC